MYMEMALSRHLDLKSRLSRREFISKGLEVGAVGLEAYALANFALLQHTLRQINDKSENNTTPEEGVPYVTVRDGEKIPFGYTKEEADARDTYTRRFLGSAAIGALVGLMGNGLKQY